MNALREAAEKRAEKNPTTLRGGEGEIYRPGVRHAAKIQKNILAAIAVAFPEQRSLETEHGLGVLLHRDRVLELGGADAAILGWMAADAAKRANRTKR